LYGWYKLLLTVLAIGLVAGTFAVVEPLTSHLPTPGNHPVAWITALLIIAALVALYIIYVRVLTDTILPYRVFTWLWCRLARGVRLSMGDAENQERMQRTKAERQRERERARQSDRKAFGTDPLVDVHLRVLGITNSLATFDEVKVAYRRKLREYHPDLFATERHEVARMAADMTVRIIEAYEFLSRKRSRV
jgi:hypothetical protein